jgi:molecular chaperone DnaK
MRPFDVHSDEMEDLRAVAPFLDEVRARYTEGPAPQIGTELLTLFVFGAAPVARTAAPPARRLPVVPRVAAGAVGALALVGGMGAAGALPGAIQRPVANVAKHVGLNLPEADTHHAAKAHPTGGTGDTPTSLHHAGDGSGPFIVNGSDNPVVVNTGGQGDPAATGGTTSGSGGGQGGHTATTTTGSSSVVGSGNAVSSTSAGHAGPSGGGGDRPPRTYHGNGRTTRTTRDPATPPTTSPPATTPTTAAPPPASTS